AGGLRMPGERLADVEDPHARGLYERVLAEEGLAPERMAVEHLAGFRLKGEDRPLIVQPAHLRVRPPEEDALNRGAAAVRVRVALPRGSYATLIVKRLFAGAVGEGREQREARAAPRRPRFEGPRERDDGARDHGSHDRRWR